MKHMVLLNQLTMQALNSYLQNSYHSVLVCVTVCLDSNRIYILSL